MTTFGYPVAPRPTAPRRSIAAKVMTPNPLAFEDHTPIQKVAELLDLHALDAAPMIDGSGRLSGMVTVAACEAWKEFTWRSATDRFASGDLGLTPVSEIAVPKVLSVRDGCSIRELVELLLVHRARRVYVTDDRDVLIGVISMSDLLRDLINTAQIALHDRGRPPARRRSAEPSRKICLKKGIFPCAK